MPIQDTTEVSTIETKECITKEKKCEEYNFDDFVVPKNHFEELFNAVSKKYMNDNANKLYMVRLWLRKNNTYAYKIGFTKMKSMMNRFHFY
jgi:hypothetical protein